MAKTTKAVKAPAGNSFLKTAMVAVIAFLLGSLVWYLGNSQKKDESQNQVRSLVQFVDDAASLVELKQEAAFSEFRQKDGAWWKGDKYIFVYDMNANTLVLPPTPDVEGKNRWNEQDPNGTFYVREMVQQLGDKNTAWVMYSYAKPGEKESSPKLAYVKKVLLGSKAIFVGSGIYY